MQDFFALKQLCLPTVRKSQHADAHTRYLCVSNLFFWFRSVTSTKPVV